MAAFAHLAMNCRDRIAQERFYTRHFGFRRARVFHPGQENEFVMLRLGDCCIELFDSPDPGAEAGDQPVGFKHVAFEVDDLDATVAGLQADGVETGDIIDAGGMVGGLRVCFFQDPEGNTLELMEGWHDEPNPPPLG
jgi:glyoxylase I family protein